MLAGRTVFQLAKARRGAGLSAMSYACSWSGCCVAVMHCKRHVCMWACLVAIYKDSNMHIATIDLGSLDKKVPILTGGWPSRNEPICHSGEPEATRAMAAVGAPLLPFRKSAIASRQHKWLSHVALRKILRAKVVSAVYILVLPAGTANGCFSEKFPTVATVSVLLP